MATGMSGGLDVAGIVAALMVKESQKLTTMQNKVSNDKVQLSGFDQLKSLLTSLNTSLTSLTTAVDSGNGVTVSDDTLISATINDSSKVYSGTHNIVVSKLAQAEVLGSATATSSRSSALGYSGDLTMTIGTNSFTVNISTSDTLDMIRDKINNASDNVGVKSSIIASTDGLGNDQFTLILASNNTGTANDVTVTGTAAASVNLTTQITSAQDATFTFDGNNVVRSTNNITDVLDGVSFNLLKTGSSSFTVAMNSDTQNTNITSALHNMVDAYNNVLAFIDQVTAQRTMTDGTLTNAKLMLQRIFGASSSGGSGISSLFDMGVTFGDSAHYTTDKGINYVSTGRLKVDDTALLDALNSNRETVKQFLTTTTTGFIDSAETAITNLTGYEGSITLTSNSISSAIQALNANIGKEQERLDSVKIALTIKYSDLNGMIDKYNRISTFLDAQFAGMSSANKQG